MKKNKSRKGKLPAGVNEWLAELLKDILAAVIAAVILKLSRMS